MTFSLYKMAVSASLAGRALINMTSMGGEKQLMQSASRSLAAPGQIRSTGQNSGNTRAVSRKMLSPTSSEKFPTSKLH